MWRSWNYRLHYRLVRFMAGGYGDFVIFGPNTSTISPIQMIFGGTDRHEVRQVDWMASGERHRCSNEGKTQNPLKFAGVSHTTEPISAISGPKFTILWGHVEEIFLFHNCFSDCGYMPQLQRHSPTKLFDGAQMGIFSDFFASCIFCEPRAAHVRPAF